MENRTTFDSLLMIDYRPGVCTDLMFRDNIELKPFFEGRERAGGSKLQRPVVVRRASGSTSYIDDGGDTPTPAQATKTTGYDTIKLMATSKEVSQHLINITKMKQYAYLEAVDNLVTEAVDEMRDSMEKHFFADAGFLATCSSASDAASKTTITFPTGTNMDQFEVGMAVAVLLKADGTVNSVGHAGTTIYSKDDDALTITLATTVADASSINSTYGVCATGSVTNDGSLLNRTPNSLYDIINTTDLHNIPVATYSEYISYIKDLSAGLETVYVQQVIDKLELRKGARIDRMFGHDSTIRKYQFELIDPRVIQQPGTGLTGTGNIYFKGRSKQRKKGEVLPIHALVYANPTDRLWFIDDSSIECWYTAFNEWMSDDHNKILHKISGKAGYEADLGSEYQFFAIERYKNGALDNIQ